MLRNVFAPLNKVFSPVLSISFQCSNRYFYYIVIQNDPESGEVSNENVLTIRADNNDALMSVFECPICFDHVCSPFRQCSNGHLVCDSCLKKVKNCPVCRVAFGSIEIRALKLERIAEAVGAHFKCGTCPEAQASTLRTLGELTEHKKTCRPIDNSQQPQQQQPRLSELINQIVTSSPQTQELWVRLSTIASRVRRVTIRPIPNIPNSSTVSEGQTGRLTLRGRIGQSTSNRNEPSVTVQAPGITITTTDSGDGLTSLQRAEQNWRSNPSYHQQARNWLQHRTASSGYPMNPDAAERLERRAREASTTLQTYMRRICLYCGYHISVMQTRLS